MGWLSYFQKMKVEGLVARSFDHRALLFSCYRDYHRRSFHNISFKYEVSWGCEKDCKNISMMNGIKALYFSNF